MKGEREPLARGGGLDDIKAPEPPPHDGRARLEEQALTGDQRRAESLKDTLNWGVRVLVWVVLMLFLGLLLVRFWHLATPVAGGGSAKSRFSRSIRFWSLALLGGWCGAIWMML